MKIKFSKHALDQLKIRARITKSMIFDVLKNPDDTSTSYRGRELYSKKYNQEVIEVVVVKEDNKLVIITAYFLEQQL